MRKKPTKYTQEERLEFLRMYHESGLSKRRFALENGLNDGRLLNSWIRMYESAKESLPLQPEHSEEDMAQQSKDQLREDNDQLRKRIKELEKALDISRMETKARDVMIDLAEKRFEIPIRKKSGAKR